MSNSIAFSKKVSLAAASVMALIASAGAAHAQAAGQNATGTNRQTNADSAGAEEIIVTAQKREERLQDVPVPVAVISSDTLSTNNQLRLQDYYQRVPGVGLTMAGDVGRPQVSIRGISTAGFQSAATVGTVVDGVPFGGTVPATAPNLGLAGDLDPSDFSRIEVLRGPQGTLYGASSLGGLMSYVTVAPSTDAVSGRLQIGANGVSGSEQLGYNMRGAVNVPLADDLALRVSGSIRRNPGYIDNVQTGQSDVNSLDARTGRFAILWKPSDTFSLGFSGLFQHLESDGATEVHLPHLTPAPAMPNLHGFQHSVLRNAGTYNENVQAYTLTATADLGGGAEFTSLTGYSIFGIDSTLDVTPSLHNLNGFAGSRGGPAPILPVIPFTSADSDTQVTTAELRKFSQEFRLTMPLGDHVDWLMGAFYTDEQYPGHVDIVVNDTPTGAPIGIFQNQFLDFTLGEYAAFTDVTVKFTDQFDVQIGARYAHVDQDTDLIASQGPLNNLLGTPGGGAYFANPKGHTDEVATTYLFSPRFRVSPDLMVYGRFATGYRPGGGNKLIAPLPGGPPTSFQHDTSTNYELGAKGNAFDGALDFDLSLYYIDWQDLQVQISRQNPVTNVTEAYTTNAGGAVSKGIELSGSWRPFDGFSLSGWVAHGDAALSDVPAGVTFVATKGTRLPYSTEWSGFLAADYEFPLSSDLTASLGASMSYTGDREGKFNTPGVGAQVHYDAYTLFNLNAGLRQGDWRLDAFVTNVADERGILRQGSDSNQTLRYAVTYTQPRTFGLSLAREF